MDFGYHYTEEQQRFRQEVKTWLDDNIPVELRDGWLPQDQEPAVWQSCLAFRKLLGDKGWLAPAEPAAQGGGGLTDAHEIVLLEELEDHRLRWFLETPSQSLKQALLPWIDQPHTGQLLAAINTGSVLLWYPWLEQVKELEPGSIGIRALRDGDDYILSGEGLFTGQGRRPDYLWVLALAGPESAPEETTAAFLVPGELDGIAVQTNRTLAPGEAMAVRFDQTRVPAYYLLGNDGDGWLLTRSAFLEEPASRHPRLKEHDLEALLRFAQESFREGVPLLDHPVLQQLLMEAHIESRINHLFRMRDAWMRSTGQNMTYHAAQTALLESRAAQRLSEISRDVMGAYALLDRRDPRAPSAGTLELQQRMSLVHQSQDSGVEGYAAAIARHLGMGITQDLSQTPSQAPFIETSPVPNHPGAATGKPEQADVSSDVSSAGPLPQK